jgi:hypothetical protein
MALLEEHGVAREEAEVDLEDFLVEVPVVVAEAPEETVA